MSLESTFCSSPWIHMRINASGGYEYCRWTTGQDVDITARIQDMPVKEYFQNGMAPIRRSMCQGQTLATCETCYIMDQHGKASGRTKQLLKTGVMMQYFDKSLQSSPWIHHFRSSQATGVTDQMPVDWQIDLGNFCNSACLFCSPDSSSRLAAEHMKMGLITSMPPPAWSDDPVTLKNFVAELGKISNLRYLHFIGGETLITPAFKEVLQQLLAAGLNTVTLGFTTNLTVWDDSVIDLLKQFQEVNLGMSVECLSRVNDYVRWPSHIDEIRGNLDRWVVLCRQLNWLPQLRVTPTILTIGHLDTIFDYAYAQGISVESCNFLHRPDFMRPTVLPLDDRQEIIHRLQEWIQRHQILAPRIDNTRDPQMAQAQVIQDAESWVSYLQKQPNESYLLPNLARYLTQVDRHRGNRVLDYLPEYEQLFRSAGYTA